MAQGVETLRHDEYCRLVQYLLMLEAEELYNYLVFFIEIFFQLEIR